ncbi:GntR family transcriptional regulator [Frigoribacterium sp. 2-23]|uniref:GntR family transcriptional regulator n=1 Tax=Frigoribacterium sp. 2-23 TaxID=3415006 RepID=UPI003C6FF9EB
MPIPTLTDQPPAPRRLLRDVVYDKMFLAIIDGTLEFGERLNDDQLVKWLGVSRTPVREAIAKLAEQALVDIEANRYTRIVAPTFDEFVDTVETGYEVWSLIVSRAVPNLTKEQKKEVMAILETRAAVMKKKTAEDIDAILHMNVILQEAANSPSLARLWAMTGPRLLLLIKRAGAVGIFPWAQAASWSTELRAAIKANDAEKAADIVRNHPKSYDDFYAELKASGLYTS